jgi:hypothetical protein
VVEARTRRDAEDRHRRRVGRLGEQPQRALHRLLHGEAAGRDQVHEALALHERRTERGQREVHQAPGDVGDAERRDGAAEDRAAVAREGDTERQGEHQPGP